MLIVRHSAVTSESTAGNLISLTVPGSLYATVQFEAYAFDSNLSNLADTAQNLRFMCLLPHFNIT